MGRSWKKINIGFFPGKEIHTILNGKILILQNSPVQYVLLYYLQKYISNSWGKHKANQYHDGDFIPDKTYWRQKEY